MRKCFHPILHGWLAPAIVCIAAAASAQEADFPPQSTADLVYMPTLTLNEEPSLCAALQDAIVLQYASDDYRIDLRPDLDDLTAAFAAGHTGRVLSFNSTDNDYGIGRVVLKERTLSGTARDLCISQLMPEPVDYEQIPSLPKLRQALNSLWGETHLCQNESPAGTTQRQALDKLALMRPWITSYPLQPKNEPALATMKSRLLSRSIYGIRARQLYTQWLGLLPMVEAELTAYYRKVYHLSASKAGQVARRWTLWLNTAGYNIAGDSDDDRGLNTDPVYSDDSIMQMRYQFRMLLAKKSDLTSFSKLIDATITKVPATELKSAFPLADAVKRLDVVELMLAAGANINDPNAFRKTPLMEAAQLNDLAAVEYFVSKGADVNLHTASFYQDCTSKVTIGNRTALFYAAENASRDLVEYLLDHGADPTAKDTAGRDALAYLEGSRMPASDKLALQARFRKPH